MKAEIAREWVEALGSGEYPKGSGSLHEIRTAPGEEDQERFCCLGVLCRLAEKHGVPVDRDERGVERREEESNRSLVRYDGEAGQLPPSVQAWAGMATQVGVLSERVGRTDAEDLGQLNDMTDDFGLVAQAIRNQMGNL